MAKGDYGFNGHIGSVGVGKRRIRVTKLDQKVSIIASEDEAKRRRAFYPKIVTSSGFTMEIVFLSYEERASFTRWLSNYMDSVVSDTAESGVMTVSVPKYEFVRTCIPETELEYGEGTTDLAYTLTMGFVGASDPVSLDLGGRMSGVSFFQMPKNNLTSKFFYPSGRQVKGAESLDGTMFDDTTAIPGIDSPGGEAPDPVYYPGGKPVQP